MAKGVKTGGGSRAGIPNKLTADVKAMILGALDNVGGQAYFEQQAIDNPQAFMTLVGKIIPKELDAKVEHNGGMTIQIVRYGSNTDTK